MRRDRKGGWRDVRDAGRRDGRRRDGGRAPAPTTRASAPGLRLGAARATWRAGRGGRSATMPRERHHEWRALTGRDRTMWARGHHAGTVGPGESVTGRHVRRQSDGSRTGRCPLPPAGARRQRTPGRRGDAAVTGPYGASLKPRLRWGSLLRVNDIGEFLEPRVCSALNTELGERLRAQQLHKSFRLADAQLPSLLQYHVKHFRVSLRRTVCRQHRSGDAGYWHINGGLTKKFVLNAFPCPVQGSSILYFQSRYLGHKSIQHRGGTRT